MPRTSRSGSPPRAPPGRSCARRGSRPRARSTWATCARSSRRTSSPRRCARAATRSSTCTRGTTTTACARSRRASTRRSRSTSACRSRACRIPGTPTRAPTPSTGWTRSPPSSASWASRCTRCASPSAIRRARTTRAIRRAMDAREPIFDTLAAQQTSGRHDTPVEERRARVLPLQAVLRDLRARRHAGHRVGRHDRDVPLPPRPRGRDLARRRRDDQRQARVEGRLADALGV